MATTVSARFDQMAIILKTVPKIFSVVTDAAAKSARAFIPVTFFRQA
jgi:hypothetical protein